MDLFFHDFWGTDISRDDSHKSYRPITVATFRLDHAIYGLQSSGFHQSNTIIYIMSVFAAYAVFKQWTNLQGSILYT